MGLYSLAKTSSLHGSFYEQAILIWICLAYVKHNSISTIWKKELKLMKFALETFFSLGSSIICRCCGWSWWCWWWRRFFLLLLCKLCILTWPGYFVWCAHTKYYIMFEVRFFLHSFHISSGTTGQIKWKFIGITKGIFCDICLYVLILHFFLIFFFSYHCCEKKSPFTQYLLYF